MLFSGNFIVISPASLLQVLCQEQRSVVISAHRGLEEATIYIYEGLVVGANYGERRGKEAVYHWLIWDNGQFRIQMIEGQPEITEMMGLWEELVLEAARRRDELEQELTPLPPYPTRQQIDTFLRDCPLLAGVAIVAYDGRLLAAVGLEHTLVERIIPLVLGLAVADAAFENVHPTVAVYTYNLEQFFFTDWGNGIFALAKPKTDADLMVAQRQLLGTTIDYEV